jgi:hypothetical protein
LVWTLGLSAKGSSTRQRGSQRHTTKPPIRHFRHFVISNRKYLQHGSPRELEAGQITATHCENVTRRVPPGKDRVWFPKILRAKGREPSRRGLLTRPSPSVYGSRQVGHMSSSSSKESADWLLPLRPPLAGEASPPPPPLPLPPSDPPELLLLWLLPGCVPAARCCCCCRPCCCACCRLAPGGAPCAHQCGSPLV